MNINYHTYAAPELQAFNNEYEEPSLEKKISWANRTVVERKLAIEKNAALTDSVSDLMAHVGGWGDESPTLADYAAALVRDRKSQKANLVSAEERLNELLNQQASTEA